MKIIEDRLFENENDEVTMIFDGAFLSGIIAYKKDMKIIFYYSNGVQNEQRHSCLENWETEINHVRLFLLDRIRTDKETINRTKLMMASQQEGLKIIRKSIVDEDAE